MKLMIHALLALAPITSQAETHKDVLHSVKRFYCRKEAGQNLATISYIRGDGGDFIWYDKTVNGDVR
jgi:hypothetical protein